MQNYDTQIRQGLNIGNNRNLLGFYLSGISINSYQANM